MDNQVIKFEDAVKQRIKDILADLIPEDRWQVIVDNTINEFERIDLPKLIKAELTEKYKEIIKEELNKPEWTDRFNNGHTLGSEMVRKLIEESAPQILSGLFGGVIQQTIYSLKNNLSSYK